MMSLCAREATKSFTSSERVVFPSLGAETLERANRRSAGGPIALGLPLKITVSPDKTFFTVALLTIMKIKNYEKKRGKGLN